MMNHPVDIPSRDDQDRATPPAGRGGGVWAVIALLVVVALAVALTLAFTGGDTAEQPESPVPNDAPVVPGE